MPSDRSASAQGQNRTNQHPIETQPRKVSVSVICAAVLLLGSLEGLVRSAPDLQLWQPDTDSEAEVILCAAGSGADLRRLWRSFSNPGTRTVLYDLTGGFGPLGAGLHGFRGYCPSEVTAERLLRCLRRVAHGQVDAPHEDLATLVRLLDSPPLDEKDLGILRLLVLGRSNKEISRMLHIPERTLGERLTFMEELFEVDGTRQLAAAAATQGLGTPYEDGPPEGIVIRTQNQYGKSKS